MRVLFVGDVCTEEGVNYLKDNLPEIKTKYKINLVVVNGENAAGGLGINKNLYKEFMKMGVNAITMGNHTYSNKEIDELLENNSNICIPANYPSHPKNGYLTIKYNDKTLTIINILGRVFMNIPLDCPFKTAKEIIDNVKSDYYLIDIHAEATSEKKALGYYLDGINGAIVGTHTHVATCDEEVLEKGTLYITDVGMTGPKDGVIGVDKDIIIKRFLEGRQIKQVGAKGKRQLNAVMLDFDNKKIERINIIEK